MHKKLRETLPQKRALTNSEQVLRKYYESTMKVLRYCSRHKGTKKVRETSDMVMVLPTESTKNTKIKMHIKLDDKSQQITQISQIIVDKRKSSNETNETNNSCNSCNSLTIKESHRMKQMKLIIRVIRVIR